MTSLLKLSRQTLDLTESGSKPNQQTLHPALDPSSKSFFIQNIFIVSEFWL